MSKTPATYIVTRKKTSKPARAMRVIIAARDRDPGDDAGLADGGTFFFEPGQSHAIPGAAAADFMADAYHADHFDIEPALPKKVIAEAVKADAARVEEPEAEAHDDAGVAKKSTGGRK